MVVIIATIFALQSPVRLPSCCAIAGQVAAMLQRGREGRELRKQEPGGC